MTLKETIITISILLAGAGAFVITQKSTVTTIDIGEEIEIINRLLTLHEEGTVCEMVEKEVCEPVCEIIKEEEICEDVCTMVEEEVCTEVAEQKDFKADFLYGGQEGSVTVNFDGYNRCRAKGGKKEVCLVQLHDQIADNIKWWKEGADAKEAEKAITDFSSELTPEDF